MAQQVTTLATQHVQPKLDPWNKGRTESALSPLSCPSTATYKLWQLHPHICIKHLHDDNNNNSNNNDDDDDSFKNEPEDLDVWGPSPE